MSNKNQNRGTALKVISIIAILFGAMTLKEGGSVLFWSDAARSAAGKFVPFVLWFNFLAGFFYILAGLGLFIGRRWAANLAVLIAALTVCVFFALGFRVISGGAYETRTLIAMTMRSGVWITIAAIAYFSIIRRP